MIEVLTTQGKWRKLNLTLHQYFEMIRSYGGVTYCEVADDDGRWVNLMQVVEVKPLTSLITELHET
jgi:hypothetical protein